jgi:hypothetical protein
MSRNIAVTFAVLGLTSFLGGCATSRPHPDYNKDMDPYVVHDTAGKQVCSSSGGNGVGCAAVFGATLLESSLINK